MKKYRMPHLKVDLISLKPLTKLMTLVAAFIACAWVLGLFGIPVFSLGLRARTFVDFSESLRDFRVLHAVQVTLLQTFFSILLSAFVGVPLGLSLAQWARTSSRWARVVEIAWAIPFSTPSLLMAFSVVAFLSAAGTSFPSLEFLQSLRYSLSAVIFAHVLYNAPFVALAVAQARRQVPDSLIAAARTLGASRSQIFVALTGPYIFPALGQALLQVALLCWMSFTLVLLLGGGPPVDSLETQLFSLIRGGGLELGPALACALWQLSLGLLIGLASFLFVNQTQGRSKLFHTRLDSSCLKPLSRISFIQQVFLILFSFVLLGISLNGLVPKSSEVIWNRERLELFFPPLVLSLKLACFVSLFTLVVAVSGVFLVWKAREAPRLTQLLTLALTLPGTVSILVVGLGVWLSYSQWFDLFEGSFVAMAAVQSVSFVPLAVRALLPLLKGVPLRSIEAAQTLGASALQIFYEIEWPRWRGPLVKAAALIAAASLGEVAAVSFFYSENLIPLPLSISRALGQYRFEDAQFGLWILMAGICVLLSLGSLISKVGHRRF